jgi:hypothetical protein
MKTQSSFPFVAAVIGAASLSLFCGCSKSDDSSTTVQATKPDGSSAAVVVSDSNVTVGSSDTWSQIKEYAFEKRADFSAGFDRMSKDMDDKAAAFRVKVAGVSDSVASDRASALKEYDDARADLTAKRTELDNATADTWASAKEKVGDSWKSTKAAFDKVTKANAPS